MAFGKPRRSSSASWLNSQAQVTLNLCPRPRFSLARLFETMTQALRIGRREHYIGLDHASRLYKHTVALLRKRDKVPLLHLEAVENLARNHHLASLADTANRISGCRGCFFCHAFKLSDERTRSSKKPS